MLRWPRSGPRSIHQDKASLLQHALRGSPRLGRAIAYENVQWVLLQASLLPLAGEGGAKRRMRVSFCRCFHRSLKLDKADERCCLPFNRSCRGWTNTLIRPIGHLLPQAGEGEMMEAVSRSKRLGDFICDSPARLGVAPQGEGKKRESPQAVACGLCQACVQRSD